MSKAISGLITKAPQLTQASLTWAKPKVATFVKYAKVELAPPTPGDIPKAIAGLRQVLSTFRSGRYKQLSVREAWLNTLVAAEIGCWFFIGECIGKRSLVGYKV